MEILLVIFLTLALFLSMILLLAAKPKFAGGITGAFILIAAIGGLFFYGYGFAVTVADWRIATLRAVINVCKMYVGGMDMGSISAAPLMQYPLAQILFWLVHLMALYATASAAITTIGAQALRKLRLWLARWGQLSLIYGCDDDTLSLGKQLLQTRGNTVVYIGEKPDAATVNAITQAGGVVRSDAAALSASVKFLRSIGANRKNRKITLYALQSDASGNRKFAKALLTALEELSASPENTRLVIRGQENDTAAALQVLHSRYGYGYVSLVQEANLAARLLVQSYPPCNTLPFDADGNATEDFRCLVIGFGRMGQAVLRQLVMNAQFSGSRFHADVFAPDCDSVKGPFCKSYPQVLCQYDIAFHASDARSEALYDYLAQQGCSLKYVVLCTGSDARNNELAENIGDYLAAIGSAMPLYLCSHSGLRSIAPDGSVITHGLYQPEVLSLDSLDRLAMQINHHYQGDPDCSVFDTWRSCDYFSRMSCRSSADFIPAFLRSAGKSAPQEDWSLTSTQLENLGRTEHLRWCAFHYCMGFSPMTQREFDTRASLYRRQLAAGEKPLRIGKNMADRTHCCLIPWEELDALSARENAITGKNVDYKAMDKENVLLVPKLMKLRG